MSKQKKIYFASDLHLGIPDEEKSLQREKRFVKWLDEIKPEASEIFLVGDVFDFWFEYAHAAPRGHLRLLGKIAELSDAGVEIHFFAGNHDLWLFGYLENELGLKIYHQPIFIEK